MSERPLHTRLEEVETEPRLRFQAREWLVIQIGWTIMAAVVLGGVLGFFGSGPLARKSIAARGGRFEVEHARFGRRLAPGDIRVHFGPTPELVRVGLRQSYLAAVKVDAIEPHPDSTELGADGVTYVFRTKGDGGEVRFTVEPQRAGLLQGTITVEGESVEFSQLVYP